MLANSHGVTAGGFNTSKYSPNVSVIKTVFVKFPIYYSDKPWTKVSAETGKNRKKPETQGRIIRETLPQE